jgi:predicted Zn-dependent protease with MMP-like domain
VTGPSNDDSFEKIVEWAYNTLPEKIRSLPDFPGIQLAEEPPVDVLKDIRERRNWPKESELMGLYSGFHRDQPRRFQSRIATRPYFRFSRSNSEVLKGESASRGETGRLA